MNLYIISGYFLFWVVCYTFREIPHIWSKSNQYKLRFEWMNTKWWTDSSPRPDRNILNVVFADAFHFFGNLPRISGIILLMVFVDWRYIFLFLVWYLGRLLIFNLVIKKIN